MQLKTNILLAALAVTLTAQTISVDLTASKWQVDSNGPVLLSNNTQGNLVFDFPAVPVGTDCLQVPCPNEAYLYQTRATKLAGAANLLLSFYIATTGTPVFNGFLEPGNNCTWSPDAKMHLLLFSGWHGEFERWWSVDAYTLAGGAGTLAEPLTPDKWTSVNGKRGDESTTTLKAFNQMLRASQVGVTFGAGCFFGHGVNVSGGTAQFGVTSFTAY